MDNSRILKKIHQISESFWDSKIWPNLLVIFIWVGTPFALMPFLDSKSVIVQYIVMGIFIVYTLIFWILPMFLMKDNGISDHFMDPGRD